MSSEITVVVPYYNESKNIETTLEQLSDQTLPAKRALFINSSSNDNTSEVIDEWIQKNKDYNVTEFENIFENTNNPGSSKNIGIKHSKTEWIAFMDCGLNFDPDWLKIQSSFVKKNEVDVSFGVVKLSGINWVDRCAVAQTYGYQRNRPCVPSTLVKRSVFERTGFFLVGRRSGYDMAWRLKLNRIGIKNEINNKVEVSYNGRNFSSTLLELFQKSILYARPALGLEGYTVPYYYLLFFFLTLFIASQSYVIGIIILLIYIFFRTFVTPVIKSNGIEFYKKHPVEALIGLGVTGIIIDFGKISGYVFGIFDYIKKKLKIKN